MSFILDALRKSEKERQQGAVPSISDVPAVVHDTRMPTWAVAVIVTLSAGVLFLGWAWMQNESGDPGIAASRPGGLLPQATTISPAAQSDVVRNLAREPIADIAASTPAAAPLPTVAAPVQVEPEPESAAMVIGAPTMLEAIADGLVLPLLTLELHVYSGTPADRFVRINSASYREGEILSDGPSVESITEEGVILSYQGENFLLSAD